MRTTSGVVLFLAGLCLGTGQAIADRPPRPGPNITAGMSDAEIRMVWTFGQEVVKVAEELGLDPAPQIAYAPRGAASSFTVDPSSADLVYRGHGAPTLIDTVIQGPPAPPDYYARPKAIRETYSLRLTASPLAMALIADLATTEWLIRQPDFAEGNPNPLTHSTLGRVGVSAAQVGLVVWMHRSGHPTMARIFGWLLTATHLIAAGWNAHWLF